MNKKTLLIIKICTLFSILTICLIYLPVLFKNELQYSLHLVQTILLSLLFTGVIGSFLRLDVNVTSLDTDLTLLEKFADLISRLQGK